MFVSFTVKNLVHRLADPRDPAYPFSDTYICSNCNERLQLDDTACDICNLNIHGMVKKSASSVPNNSINGTDNSFITIKKAKHIPHKKYKSKKLSSNSDVTNIEVSSLFKESVTLVLVLGLMVVALIAYDLNQNIAKTRGNNLEIVN